MPKPSRLFTNLPHKQGIRLQAPKPKKVEQKVGKKVGKVGKGKAKPVFYTKSVNSNGRAIVNGGKDLKPSEHYPTKYCRRLASIAVRMLRG
eukprot:4880026-Alexandrium_andersonii.AAC.1